MAVLSPTCQLDNAIKSAKQIQNGLPFGLLLFLTLLNVMNFTCRMLPTSLGRQIQQELHINNASSGLLSGYYFILTYSIFSFIFGFLSDRLAPRKIIFVALLLWGSMTLLSGIAHDFGQMIVARLLLGAGQAALTPAALLLIRNSCNRSKMAWATGIYYSGLSLGGGVSLLVSGWLEPILQWRGCFIALGAATLVMVLPVLFLPSSGRKEVVRPERHNSHASMRMLFQSPLVWLTLAGAICIVFMSAAGNLRMVWLQKERGFGVGIGVIAGLLYMTGGMSGNLIGGWLGDFFEKRRNGGRLLFVAWAQLLMSPVVLLSYWLFPQSTLFYVAWFGAIVATTLYYGPVYAAIQEMAPGHLRATATGMLIFAVNLIGVGGGPWLAGSIGDHSSLTNGLMIASCSSFLAFPCFWLAARIVRRKG